MRLVAVVLATGVLGLGLIGGLTALRLQQQLRHQAGALGELSEDRRNGAACRKKRDPRPRWLWPYHCR
ncbi:hypothetical protein NK6_2233 [Bradyrhizobium diazoefficiens]|uniref:Uncharacterized protein n=1 Tax=Bradyrhizobium diazoefficiens TaxID=1355477 RepID=A0A0E4BLT3_9BRAD|nr:hypothetical protein NK6_2233 [Bradyrhizobium diazoefficiens]